MQQLEKSPRRQRVFPPTQRSRDAARANGLGPKNGRPESQAPLIRPAAATMRVVGLDAQQRILVAAASSAQAMPARLLKPVRRKDLFDADGLGREVLVVFDGDRLDRPIIIGVMAAESEAALESPPGQPDPPDSGRERLVIEAGSELVLKCGSGSITLRQDGKIVLRGTHLLSRASGPIRIKGGHVEIN